MRKYLPILALCLCCQMVFGQDYLNWYSCKTEQDFNKYFTENVLSLDPLEGVYTLNSGYIQYSPIFGENRILGNTDVVIVKNHEGYFEMYILEDHRFSDTIFQHVVENSYYYIDEPHNVKMKFLFDGSHFKCNYEMSATQKRKVFRGIGDAVRVASVFEGTKTFPTIDTYRRAREKEIERQEKESEPSISSGTGFALNNGHIITNYHVVEEAKSILIYVDSDVSYSATIVATDRINDLAILRISDPNFKGFGKIPYAIKTQMADVGEDVWVLGYPLTQVLGNEIKLTTGVISSKSGYQGEVSTYQISAPVQPGNSGGPLFDSKGNIIGIVNAGVPGAENVGYAIKTSYLQNLVDSYSLSSCLPKNNTISSLILKEQVKRVEDFVFLIICSLE